MPENNEETVSIEKLWEQLLSDEGVSKYISGIPAALSTGSAANAPQYSYPPTMGVPTLPEVKGQPHPLSLADVQNMIKEGHQAVQRTPGGSFQLSTQYGEPINLEQMEYTKRINDIIAGQYQNYLDYYRSATDYANLENIRRTLRNQTISGLHPASNMAQRVGMVQTPKQVYGISAPLSEFLPPPEYKPVSLPFQQMPAAAHPQISMSISKHPGYGGGGGAKQTIAKISPVTPHRSNTGGYTWSAYKVGTSQNVLDFYTNWHDFDNIVKSMFTHNHDNNKIVDSRENGVYAWNAYHPSNKSYHRSVGKDGRNTSFNAAVITTIDNILKTALDRIKSEGKIGYENLDNGTKAILKSFIGKTKASDNRAIQSVSFNWAALNNDEDFKQVAAGFKELLESGYLNTAVFKKNSFLSKHKGKIQVYNLDDPNSRQNYEADIKDAVSYLSSVLTKDKNNMKNLISLLRGLDPSIEQWNLQDSEAYYKSLFVPAMVLLAVNGRKGI